MWKYAIEHIVLTQQQKYHDVSGSNYSLGVTISSRAAAWILPAGLLPTHWNMPASASIKPRMRKLWLKYFRNIIVKYGRWLARYCRYNCYPYTFGLYTHPFTICIYSLGVITSPFLSHCIIGVGLPRMEHTISNSSFSCAMRSVGDFMNSGGTWTISEISISAESMLLLARHWKLPASDSLMDEICSDPVPTIRNLESKSLISMSSPLRNHLICGRGFPLATQSNVTVDPSFTVFDTDSVKNVGCWNCCGSPPAFIFKFDLLLCLQFSRAQRNEGKWAKKSNKNVKVRVITSELENLRVKISWGNVTLISSFVRRDQLVDLYCTRWQQNHARWIDM